MSAAAWLLQQAENAGLGITLDGDGRVRVRGRSSPDLLAAMRVERDAIAAELRRRDLAGAMAERAEALDGIMAAQDVAADREAVRRLDGAKVDAYAQPHHG